jgi:hypothetical protein
MSSMICQFLPDDARSARDAPLPVPNAALGMNLTPESVPKEGGIIKDDEHKENSLRIADCLVALWQQSIC